MEAQALQLVGLAPPLHTKSFSAWMRKSSHCSSPFWPPSSKGGNQLHAQGRGFGATVIPDQKSRSERGSNDDKNNEYDDEISEVVVNRMMKRILITVGTPMASAIGLLCLMGFLKENNVWDVPMWLPFLTILLGFGTSALGIAYGTLSSSWEPETEGSLLGWEQAQKNWPELWKDEHTRR